MRKRHVTGLVLVVLLCAGCETDLYQERRIDSLNRALARHDLESHDLQNRVEELEAAVEALKAACSP